MTPAPAHEASWQVPAYETVWWKGKRHGHVVVIPVINEQERIRKLLERMRQHGIADRADILIMDGGSTDGSLERSMLEGNGVRGLLVKKGPGRLSAQLRCAYAFCLVQGYTGIITIDGNDKDDPEPIARFIEALESGADFVQASRFIPGGIAENTPVVRTLAIRLLHAPLLSLASGFHWTDTTQGFRGYSARLLRDERVAVFRDAFSDYELLAYLSYRAPRLGYRCLELPTARRYPDSGPVPTKIGGMRGNVKLLKTLVRVCAGRYDPR